MNSIAKRSLSCITSQCGQPDNELATWCPNAVFRVLCDVSRPLGIAVALRPKIEISIDGPDAQIGISALSLVEHLPHVEELEVIEVIYIVAISLLHS